MAVIRPFRAVRPSEEKVSAIAALPYDVYNRKEATEVVKKNPLSFLAIDRAETSFGPEVDTYDDQVYEKARSLYEERKAEGSFICDEDPCFYIYELEMDGHVQTGIVGCASVDDYENGVIKKHENTRAEKEQDRIRHVDALSAQTGPIFLAHHTCKALTTLKDAIRKEKPLYDFVAEDGIAHRVWKITDQDVNDQISALFDRMNSIYIADGHHRCASAVRVSQMRRQAKKDYTGEEEFNYFLSVLFDEEQLRIFDYNRVVKDLNGLETDEFLSKIKEKFNLKVAGSECYRPENKGCCGMFLDNEWFKLTVKDEYKKSDAVGTLDASILQELVLGPILGIGDPRTDDRIDFVGGIRGLSELERRVHKDCRVAFSMYPTSMQELFAVADANLLMPPKSTWFEPKLRSGLLIHEIEK